MAKLTEQEKIRYDRQMMIDGWGQAKLGNASVFVAGAGGLGSPVSIYLAVAGVGQIRLCDADVVERSNLNRQILHGDGDVGQLKTLSAQKSLGELNPNVDVVAVSDYLDEENVEQVVDRPDVVVDCLDNFETRYLLNAYCVRHRIPFVHGAVWGLIGQVTFLSPPETPCLRCIFPQAPPKEVFPVLGATPGVIGCLQAMETLKYLTGIGINLSGKLLFFDGEEMSFSSLEVKRSPDCPVCAHRA